MPNAAHVETLVLPGSGWCLQWRADGYWRELGGDQLRDEHAGLHVPDDDDWVRWSGTYHQQARGGGWDGVPVWWVLSGELPDETAPDVVLADGRRPAPHTVGRVWACEWLSVAQPATLHLAGGRYHFPFAEPMVRRSSPTIEGPGGWVRSG